MHAEEPVHLKEIMQIAITVSDLPRSKAFYSGTLGLQPLFDAGTMSFLECGSVRILLGLPEPGKEISTPGTILYFKVDDLESVHARLSEAGVPVVQAPRLIAKMPDHDLWLAIVSDPDGNPVGLMSELQKV